jgi:hypothetical protein
MNKDPRNASCSTNTHSKTFSLSRRTTFMLVVGALTGTMSRSARANDGVGREALAGEIRTAGAARDDDAEGAMDGMTAHLLDLKKLGPEHRVQTIKHCHDTFQVTTADGQSAEFRERNLRFRIDSSEIGPRPGDPIILPAGSMGDRASVFFASPQEIGAFIERQD